jgi:DNA-binding NarL/FixJ family response regulator
MVSDIRLSPREQQIAERLQRGESPGEIASALGISRKTVYTYVNLIAGRLPLTRGGPLRRVLKWTLMQDPKSLPKTLSDYTHKPGSVE